MQFLPKPIAELKDTPKDAVVDILGLVYHVENLKTIARNGMDVPKRTISLLDQSGMGVDLTIWGERAETMQESSIKDQILACKSVRLSDWNGR